MGGNSGKKARPKKMPNPALKSPLADEQKPAVKEVAKTKETLSAKQQERRTKLLNLMNDILKEADGLESNVPMNSKYWEYVTEFRSLEPQTL